MPENLKAANAQETVVPRRAPRCRSSIARMTGLIALPAMLACGGLADDSDPETGDGVPSIASTPSPAFTQGRAGIYQFSQNVSDDGRSALQYSLTDPLASGLSFASDSGELSYDGVGAGSVSAHQLTVMDAVGSAQSSTFNVSVITAAPAADWNERVAAATGGGTITNFDTLAEGLDSLDPDPNGNNSWEQGVKQSGGGSYRVDILEIDSTLSGEKNLYLFTDEHELGAGEEVYIQFRQYFPAFMIDHVWEGDHDSRAAQSFKSLIVSSSHSTTGGDGSNTNSEHVIQGSKQRGYIQGYHQDGNSSAIYWSKNLSTACSGTDIAHQPAIDRNIGNAPSTCAEAEAKYGGLFSTDNEYVGRALEGSGAFNYHKVPGVGNWVTFKLRIKIDPTGQTNDNN